MKNGTKKTRKNVLKWILLILLIILVGILYIIIFAKPRPVYPRTKDVARKTELYEVQRAILMSQKDIGEWPQLSQAVNGMSVRGIENELLTAGMSYVPGDPIQSNVVSGFGDKSITGDYMYMVSMRGGVPNGGFILMAKMDDEKFSNWIVCDNGEGNIQPGEDLVDIKLCETVSKGNSCSNSDGVCTYTSVDQLRYLLIH